MRMPTVPSCVEIHNSQKTKPPAQVSASKIDEEPWADELTGILNCDSLDVLWPRVELNWSTAEH